MPKFLKIVFFIFIVQAISIFAQVNYYQSQAVFFNGNNTSYVEPYLTISGNTVKYQKVKNKWRASVNVNYKISKGNEEVKVINYNVLGSLLDDTIKIKPSFIDYQRFALPNGEYQLECTIMDNMQITKKVKQTSFFKLEYSRQKTIYTSSVMPISAYTKKKSEAINNKNGYDLVPYTINYYPKSESELTFYFEIYNADTTLGKQTSTFINYYLENSETFQRVEKHEWKTKQESKKINALISKINLEDVSSGNYNLVIEVKDSLNKLHKLQKWFFQRLNTKADSELLTKAHEKHILNIENLDTLKILVESLWARSSNKEREWQHNIIKSKNSKLIKNFLISYWTQAAGDSVKPIYKMLQYYKLIFDINAKMKCGNLPGYITDRGRVLLQYGTPNVLNQYPSKGNTYPYEVWQYYQATDAITNQKFTNKKFIFCNSSGTINDYKLIHSTMLNESQYPNWKSIVSPGNETDAATLQED